jgi:hypothetical protein
MNGFNWDSMGPTLVIGILEYRVTGSIMDAIPRDVLDGMVATAEQARINRGVDISVEKMYMIRLMYPPSDRKISVVFIEDMEGIRRNFIAYFDEIEGILRPGYESGDIKKFAGSPFDSRPQTVKDRKDVRPDGTR